MTKIYVKKPSPAAVLYCLLSDAAAGSELFADFCAELGYDEDSRRALAILLTITGRRRVRRPIMFS